jgi:activating signal cointegrator 1
MMKAISLWQPWASLWLSDAKVHETRHWPTTYRGWLVVHAAKRKIDDLSGDRLDEICDGIWGHHWGMELPRGALIGAIKLVSCKRMDKVVPASDDDRECGDWSDERYAWQRDPQLIVFDQPIPYKGAQGFFEVPDNLLPRRTVLSFPGSPDLELKLL